MNGDIYALVRDSAGNLYLRSGRSPVAALTASYIAKWDGVSGQQQALA